MSGYQDEKKQTKIRADFDEVFPRIAPSATTLQLADEIWRRGTDRTVASGSVAFAWSSAVVFKIAKDSGPAQIVGTRRDQLDPWNLNNNLERFTIQALVTTHMVAYFPTDAALGSYSGTHWPVKSVEKYDWGGEEDDYTADIVFLCDHYGVALTDLPAALAGKTVTFKDTLRVHPGLYNFYYLDETAGPPKTMTLIPRPTGNDSTDQYRLDCVTGEITLRAPWVAARPAFSQYCFRINMSRLARSNEVMREHGQEVRTVLENINAAKVTLGRDELTLTAGRGVLNRHFWKVDDPPTQIVRASELDWSRVCDPIVIGTAGPGAPGFTLDTGLNTDAPWRLGRVAYLNAQLPLLTVVGKNFLSMPHDWHIDSATLRFKAHLVASEYWWNDPPDVVNHEPAFNPKLGCGWCFDTLGDTYCQNYDRKLDDDDADPICRIRGNCELFKRADDNDWCGWVLPHAALDGPIEYQETLTPPYYWWYDLDRKTSGWAHECAGGPPAVGATTPELAHRSQTHFFETYGGTVVRITGHATQANLLRDVCHDRITPVKEPKLSNPPYCSFGGHYHRYSMPQDYVESNFEADGEFHLMDVTVPVSAMHARKKNVPGTFALLLGPKYVCDWFKNLGGVGDHVWGEIVGATYPLDPLYPGGTQVDVIGWAPTRMVVNYVIDHAELKIVAKTPDGMIVPLAPSGQWAGLDAV